MRRRDEDLKINSDCIRKEGKMSYRLVRKQNSEQIVESAVESLDVARHHEAERLKRSRSVPGGTVGRRMGRAFMP